jgi:hypothetical protein
MANENRGDSSQAAASNHARKSEALRKGKQRRWLEFFTTLGGSSTFPETWSKRRGKKDV